MSMLIQIAFYFKFVCNGSFQFWIIFSHFANAFTVQQCSFLQLCTPSLHSNINQHYSRSLILFLQLPQQIKDKSLENVVKLQNNVWNSATQKAGSPELSSLYTPGSLSLALLVIGKDVSQFLRQIKFYRESQSSWILNRACI